MSKASIAQEPSMDEILASIRRIIETGDEREKVPAAQASRIGGFGSYRIGSSFSEAAVAEGAAPQQPERSEESAPSATASELMAAQSSSPPNWPHTVLAHAPSSAEPSPDHRLPAGSSSENTDEDRLTAELESELAATWDRVEASAPAAGETQIVDRQDGDDELEEAQPMPTEQESWIQSSSETVHAPSTVEPSDARSFADTHAQDGAHYESSSSDHGTFQPANTDHRFEVERVGRDEPSFEGHTAPLTSDATSNLVGASFNELAQAIRSGELRSLEQMAQEMLAPLLREWLDDNLPRMVERLVREEIDRMSRGGRR